MPLKVKFWARILSEQSFKQSCCFSLCFKDCSLGDHRLLPARAVDAQGCCFAAPIWTEHSRSFLVLCIPVPPLPAPFPLWFPVLLKSPGSCGAAPSSGPSLRRSCPVPSPGTAPANLPSLLSAACVCPNIYSMPTSFHFPNKRDLSSLKLTFRSFPLQQLLQE